LKLEARNFGPIENLNIDIRPLTILIGKNSLGKSYTSELFYALLCVLGDLKYRIPALSYGERVFLGLPHFAKEFEIKRLTSQIRKEKLIDAEIVRRLADLILEEETQKVQVLLKTWLERIFGVRLSKLININSSAAQIECELFEDLVFKATITKRKLINVKLTVEKQKLEEYVKELAPILEKIRQRSRKKTYVEELADALQEKLMRAKKEAEFFKIDFDRGRIIPKAYYVPAGRAGLIESYDTVVEALFFHAAEGTPAFGFSIPPLSGMAAEFYSVIRSLNGQKGPFGNLTGTWFKDLLNGDVVLQGVRFKRGQKAIRNRMIYRFHVGDKRSAIDLVHAASMIKELAPIYLIIRELVHPSQFLIIEEPESHLHPGAQYKLSRILAELATQGVRVLITTHSPVMLRRLSHFVGGKPDGKETILSPNNVSIYWLKDEKYGCVSKTLKISKYGTLDELPTFDEVINELYEEEVTHHKENED
jgi:predicted ATPase